MNNFILPIKTVFLHEHINSMTMKTWSGKNLRIRYFLWKRTRIWYGNERFDWL